MKMRAVRFLVVLSLLAVAAVAFANPFKSKIIKGDGTDSTVLIIIPDDHFLKITNFTQEDQVEGTVLGVVEVTLPGNTENGGRTNVLTATRINPITGANSQNFPNLIVAGPAEVRVAPVPGATLFITYKKERDEGSGGGGGGSPIPAPTIPGPTPAPTLSGG
jgi:hypothetical protein